MSRKGWSYYSGNSGMGFGYGRGSSKSYNSRSYSSWDDDRWGGNFSWGRWGSFSYDEDDDKDLYIKAHDGYFTPKAYDIEKHIKYAFNTKTNKDLIKEMSRYFYYRMLDDKDYFHEKYADETKLTEKELGLFKQKQQFYEALWDKFIPGDTPLEKSLAVFKQLIEEKQEQNKRGQKGDPKDEELDANAVQFHEEIYTDPEYNEILDANAFSKKRKFDVLNKIALIRNLGSQFKVEKEIEEKIVANSSVITKKIMRDYSQIANIDLYQKLMPTFNIKLLTKDLVVNVPVDRTENKQKIIILLDFSGSMSSLEKQEWVTAVLVDRLRYAAKEEAEVFFSYFVNDPDHLHFTHIYNKETALKFWSKFSHNPNGGDTKLGNMVNRVKGEIEKKRLMNLSIDLSSEKPEILAINDGQDSVKTNGFVYKTNAMSLVDQPNEELKKLCVDNEGKYVFVHQNNKCETWSKEGHQELKV